MSKIIDRTKDFYPSLEGAEYLQYVDDSLPEGLIISKSNVVVNGKDKLMISPAGCYWGWVKGGSFCRNFDTPQEAISDYQKYVDFKKNS